jgi:hypothetical protein
MKIIKQADTSLWSCRFTCDECDSELEAAAADVRYKYYPGDCRDPSYENYDVECPICHKIKNLTSKNIPKAVRLQAKNKSSKGTTPGSSVQWENTAGAPWQDDDKGMS